MFQNPSFRSFLAILTLTSIKITLKILILSALVSELRADTQNVDLVLYFVDVLYLSIEVSPLAEATPGRKLNCKSVHTRSWCERRGEERRGKGRRGEERRRVGIRVSDRWC